MNLEQQFKAACANDPRYVEISEPFCRGLFILGAQAVLECLRINCPDGPNPEDMGVALAAINLEIGVALGLKPPPKVTVQ